MTKKPKRIQTLIATRLVDIALIIISVSVALAVNTWAGKKNDHDRLKQYYTNFIDEISEDIDNLKTDTADAGQHIKNCDWLLANSKTNIPMDSVLLPFSKLFSSTLFGSDFVSYQSMIASGDMKLIQNLAFRMALIKFDNYYKSIKIHEDLYLTFVTHDLTEYLNAQFDLTEFKPFDTNFYKKVKYKNLVYYHRNLNKNRLAEYSQTLDAAINLKKLIELELKKE